VAVLLNVISKHTVVSFVIDDLITLLKAMETILYLVIFMLIIDAGFTRAGKQNRRSMEELVSNSGSNREEAGMGT
jgi:hypothetical protein